MNEDIRKYLAEFIGTFTLVFIGTSVATLQGGLLGPYGSGGLIMVAFAFGATLGVMVLVIGPVSGCHINPAVTIPMAISGRLKGSLAPGYIIAQCLGAIAASGVLMTLAKGVTGPEAYDLARNGLGANGDWKVITTTSAFGWELVMTALFLFTIFAATRSNFTPGFHAVAIGGFLFVAHLIGVQLGDSSLNPARSLGPALLSGHTEGLWVFIVGPIVGGVIGWIIYKVIYAD